MTEAELEILRDYIALGNNVLVAGRELLDAIVLQSMKMDELLKVSGLDSDAPRRRHLSLVRPPAASPQSPPESEDPTS